MYDNKKRKITKSVRKYNYTSSAVAVNICYELKCNNYFSIRITFLFYVTFCINKENVTDNL